MVEPSARKDVEALIQGYLEGSLTIHECKRLQQYLEKDPVLGAEIVRNMGMEALIREVIRQQESELHPLDGTVAAGSPSATGSDGPGGLVEPAQAATEADRREFRQPTAKAIRTTAESARRREEASRPRNQQQRDTHAPALRLFPYNRGAIALAVVVVALVLGLFAYVYSPTLRETQVPSVAKASGIAGEVNLLRSAGKQPVGLAPETALFAGDALAAGAQGRFSLKLADGSTIDADAHTELTLADGANGEALTLAQGRIYCEIAKRKPGQPPLSIRTATGYRAAVLGTRFELDCAKDGCTLKVEEGRVEFSNAQKTVRVSAQEMSTASAGKSPAEPLPILTCGIAEWKFQPKPVAPGTIVFQDDFENGASSWEFFGRKIRVVDGQGIGGSRCLEVDCRDLPANERCTVALKMPARWNCFSVQAQIKALDSAQRKGGVTATLEALNERGMIPHVVTPDRLFSGKPGGYLFNNLYLGQWYVISEAINAFPENRPFLYQYEGQTAQQDVFATRWTIMENANCRVVLSCQAGARYLIDNVVVKSDSPETHFPAQVLYQDSFATETGFWSVSEGTWARETDKAVDPSLWGYATNPQGNKSILVLDCPLDRPVAVCRFKLLVPDGADNSATISREDPEKPGHVLDSQPISLQELRALPEAAQHPELIRFAEQIEAGGSPANEHGTPETWWYVCSGHLALISALDRQGHPCPVTGGRGQQYRLFSQSPGKVAVCFQGTGPFRLNNVWVVGYSSFDSFLKDF